MREQEDAAWRSIVENFGERVRLDDAEPFAEPVPDEELDDLDDDLVDEPEYSPILDAPEERFHPPPPPPLPRPHGLRGAAWVGVLGAPLLLLAFTLASIGLPSLVAYALVAVFVAGFTYLVLTMPRGPRDPWDDGARV